MKRAETDHPTFASFDPPVADVSRYDLVLAVIPLLWVVAAGVGSVLSLPPSVVGGGTSLACSVVLADALYRNPPTAEYRREPDSLRGAVGDGSGG